MVTRPQWEAIPAQFRKVPLVKVKAVLLTAGITNGFRRRGKSDEVGSI